MEIFTSTFDFQENVNCSEEPKLPAELNSSRLPAFSEESKCINSHTHHSLEHIQDIAEKIKQKHDLFTEIDRLKTEKDTLFIQFLDLKESAEKVQQIIQVEKSKVHTLEKQIIVLNKLLREAEEKNQLKVSSKELLSKENRKLTEQIEQNDNISLKYIHLAYLVFHKKFKSMRAPTIIKNIRDVQNYVGGLSSEKRHTVKHILSWNPKEDVLKVLPQNKISPNKKPPCVSPTLETSESEILSENVCFGVNDELEIVSSQECEGIGKKADAGTMFPDPVYYDKSLIRNILEEMSETLNHISPISELEPNLFKRNRSTNTELKGINTNIGVMPLNVKQSHSRPPSRIGLIKAEKINGEHKSGALKLWEILGQTIFALIQQGKNEFQDNEIAFFNDKMQFMVDFLQKEKANENQTGKFAMINLDAFFYGFLKKKLPYVKSLSGCLPYPFCNYYLKDKTVSYLIVLYIILMI